MSRRTVSRDEASEAMGPLIKTTGLIIMSLKRSSRGSPLRRRCVSAAAFSGERQKAAMGTGCVCLRSRSRLTGSTCRHCWSLLSVWGSRRSSPDTSATRSSPAECWRPCCSSAQPRWARPRSPTASATPRIHSGSARTGLSYSDKPPRPWRQRSLWRATFSPAEHTEGRDARVPSTPLNATESIGL